MSSKQEMKRKALRQRKKSGQRTPLKVTKHDFKTLTQQRETVTSIGVMVFDHLPSTPKEQSDLAHFQWLQANRLMERTDTKRLPLEDYNGSWVRMAGVVSEAKLRHGVLRICVAAPELLLEENGTLLLSEPIDSHLWIKMSQFIINDHEDDRVDNRPKNQLKKGTLKAGLLSLGDYFSFDAYIEPYIVHKNVKYGVSKIKNISSGGLLWKNSKQREKGTQYIHHYPRSGWLINANPIEGTNKFNYRFADWEMIQQQVNFFEHYQSDYAVELRERTPKTR